MLVKMTLMYVSNIMHGVWAYILWSEQTKWIILLPTMVYLMCILVIRYSYHWSWTHQPVLHYHQGVFLHIWLQMCIGSMLYSAADLGVWSHKPSHSLLTHSETFFSQFFLFFFFVLLYFLTYLYPHSSGPQTSLVWIHCLHIKPEQPLYQTIKHLSSSAFIFSTSMRNSTTKLTLCLNGLWDGPGFVLPPLS